MNQTENNTPSTNEIDASCRVPLLALFGGAALWLVLGLLLGLAAAMSFHKPDLFSDCPGLTFGHAQAAANDLILYGFIIPAALGVVLWIFARLSQAPVALPIVPVAAANLWHVGVLIGTVAILTGNSTGYPWLEYPRAAAVLLFAGFLLTAVSIAATMGFRARRDLYPSHWFLFAALLWFAWSYSSANLFLVSSQPPRGVVQAIIDWWFANNALFVFLGLTGVGIACYFLPKLLGKPLASDGYVMFAFVTFIAFGTWCCVPPGSPVPAWLPTISTYTAMLSLIPILAIAIITRRTIAGTGFQITAGPQCFVKFGIWGFVVSSVLYLSQFCPRVSAIVDFTWYGFGVTQWQLFGFLGMILIGSIYYILPRAMEKELPYPGFAKLSFFVFAIGIVLYVLPLVIGGIEQGLKMRDTQLAFADAGAAALVWFRVSTTGQLILLLGSLLLLLNIFVMTIQWKLSLAKTLIAAVKAPLATSEVKS